MLKNMLTVVFVGGVSFMLLDSPKDFSPEDEITQSEYNKLYEMIMTVAQGDDIQHINSLTSTVNRYSGIDRKITFSEYDILRQISQR